MNTDKIIAWLRTPTTINGIAELVALGSALAAHLLNHDLATDAAVGGAVMGALKIILPDNSAAQTDLAKLAKDALQAEAQKNVGAMMPALMGDLYQSYTDIVAKHMAAAGVASVVPAKAPVVISTAPVIAPVVAPVVEAPLNLA